jgi:26S proteasome regulatory subunit T5
MDVTPDPPAETWSDLPEELLTASAEEIVTRRRLIENDIRVGLHSFILLGSPGHCAERLTCLIILYK